MPLRAARKPAKGHTQPKEVFPFHGNRTRFTLGESELSKSARKHCDRLLDLFHKREKAPTGRDMADIRNKTGAILAELERLHNTGELLSPGASVEGERIRGLTSVGFAIKKNPFRGYNLIIEGE